MIGRLVKKTAGVLLRSVLLLTAASVILTASLMLGLRWLDPPTSSYIVRYEHAAKRPAKREWVNFEQIAWPMALAVIAAEDQQFPKHFGFDWRQIKLALKENKGRNIPRGASTISQQTIKNLFLWPGRSYFRKAVEAWLTVWMELLVPKKRILEIYLNIAQFGKSVFGVQAAAKHYFGTRAQWLTPRQARLLAASLPTPSSSNPAKPSDYLLSRDRALKTAMQKLGGKRVIDRL